MATQATCAAIQVTMWLLVLVGAIRLWMVFASGVAFGVVIVFDLPAGAAFVAELVGDEYVANAVSLNSAVGNAARIVGPGLASLIIAAWGTSWAFLVDAVAFAGVVLALSRMRSWEFTIVEKAQAAGSIRKAYSYARGIRELRPTAALLAVTTLLVFYFPIEFSLMSTRTLGGGPDLAGLMMTIFGVGATIGALASTSCSRPTPGLIIWAAMALGVSLVTLSLLASKLLILVALVPVGCVAFFFATVASAHLLVATRKEMHGRLMGMYGLVMAAAIVVGGPLVGWICQYGGVQSALAVGGAATFLTAVVSAVFAISPRREPLA